MKERHTTLASSTLDPQPWPPCLSTMPHLPLDHLARAMEQLDPPRDRGTLSMIVARQPGNGRQTPPSAVLSSQHGVPGDNWFRTSPGTPEAQITMMRIDIARLVANGQPVELAGDNLLVDLDLSVENLPTGTRLRIGEAVLVVTALPHNGCAKFRQRFGDGALKLTEDRRWRHLRLRGIYATVIEEGEVVVGDLVEVLERPTASAAAPRKRGG